MKKPTEEQIKKWQAERAALTNPIDRIVWDNENINRALWVRAAELEEKEQNNSQ